MFIEVLLSFHVVTSIVYNPLPAMWKSYDTFSSACCVDSSNGAVYRLKNVSLQSGSTLSNFRDVGVGLNSETRYATARQCVLKETFIEWITTVREHSELQKEIETPALLAHEIENTNDIFGISGGGGVEPPNHPRRYATGPWYWQ